MRDPWPSSNLTTLPLERITTSQGRGGLFLGFYHEVDPFEPNTFCYIDDVGDGPVRGSLVAFDQELLVTVFGIEGLELALDFIAPERLVIDLELRTSRSLIASKYSA